MSNFGFKALKYLESTCVSPLIYKTAGLSSLNESVSFTFKGHTELPLILFPKKKGTFSLMI